MANPLPGTVIPVGALVSPGGAQGTAGPTGPTGATGPAGTVLGPVAFLTGAYTLTSADSNKYFICSGGSWTLTLPTPAVSLAYRVRNDMGITGTTGIITIACPVGQIDGAGSLALLAGQEVLIMTDGTNWRSFGRQRAVIIGTQDITISQASGVVLLPVGYRYFELEFTGYVPDVASTVEDYLLGQFSLNGGATWVTTGYYHGTIANSSATATTFWDSENIGSFYISSYEVGSAASIGYASSRLVIYPGSANTYATVRCDMTGRNTGSVMSRWLLGGLAVGSNGPVNALKYYGASGYNILNSFLTVKGVV